MGKGILSHYPLSRKLEKQEEEEVFEILNLRPSNKHIQHMIERKYGRFVTLKDIQNMKTKIRERSMWNGRCTAGVGLPYRSSKGRL